MAHRSPHRLTSDSSSPVRQRRALRHSPTPRRRKPDSLLANFRPVLVPLHPNLRRLPSRIYLDQKESEMREVANHQVGSKRKRVASTNENALTGGRPINGLGRLKRQRVASHASVDYASDSSESLSMDVDSQSCHSSTVSSDIEEESRDEDDDESSDDYLITSAEPQQLQRLRKDELARLYTLAGLSDDTDSLTKSEIIDSIIAARDDIASLPPSSPVGRGDGNSSEYSSDDGAVEEDSSLREMTSMLRRRATTNDVIKSKRPAKSRSLSMGQLQDNSTRHVKHSVGDSSGSSAPRRRTSSRSSPSNSIDCRAFQSPPAHHLRSRKVSAPAEFTGTDSSLHMLARSLKAKGKQVEFRNDVQVKVQAPVKAPGRSQKVSGFGVGEESDLTELDESEADTVAPQPSPRRLRSKDRESKDKGVAEEGHSLDARRIVPMRKAKRKVQNLCEDDTEMEGDDDDDEDDEDEENEDEDEDEDEQVEEDEQAEDGEEEEVDQLVSVASPTPPPVTRTPVKRRLRPRPERIRDEEDNHHREGVDEEENDDDGEENEEVEVENDNEEDESPIEEEEHSSMEEDDEATVIVEPRKLRNGKIVGEDADLEDEIITDEDMVDEEETESNEDGALSSDDHEDQEDESHQETMEEDVDLTIATAKTLIRMRRDDLVRLCETRDLDPVGTKPQLAEALLEWRDRQANDMSSPSSTGTIRPPSTVVKRRRGGRKSPETPVLERSHHFHMDEPLTPSVSQKKEGEPELELDLGTLGLEDREIPPEKLQKLEKIGSGGFKDVFVGKFRGKKVAIAEFRGQLSAMDIKELKLLGGFDHPNIVRFLGVSIPENPRDTPVMIISELCANGDLFDYVRNVNPPSLHKILSIMLDIARGLEYLHLRKPSVIHRDCKSSNILITSKGTAKIADFGLAKVKQSTRSMVRSLVGTVNWQAPELWHAHPKYNHKVDVFSCAMVYWEMLQWHLPNKKFPWEGMNEHAIYEIVGTKKQRPSISGLRKQWCPEVVDLIERMWAQEHQDRPTMTEVVEALEEMLSCR